VREPGFLVLEEWIGMKPVVSEKTHAGEGFTVKGAILEK
jgi:hypothetical protein